MKFITKNTIVTVFLISSFLFYGCTSSVKDYTRYVDAFICTGGHGHTFPGDILPYGMIQLCIDTRLTGWDACTVDHLAFFHAEFSQPFTATLYSDGSMIENTDYLTDKDIQAFLKFDKIENEEVFVKVGISSVDNEGVRKNLKAEITDRDFKKVRKNAKEAWNKQLSKIEIKGKNTDHLKIFIPEFT